MSKNANSKNRTQNTYNSTNETDRTTSKNAYDSKNSGVLRVCVELRITERESMTKTAITTLTTKTKWNKPLPLFYDTGAVPCCTCYFFT